VSAVVGDTDVAEVPPARASRSDALRERNAAVLAVSADRALMQEIATGTVSTETYARYLAVEEDFVRTAVRVAGFCLWAEPVWDRAARHGDVVTALLGEQLDYFAALREEWVADGAELEAVLERASVLRRYVLDAVATGQYAAAVTGMFAAETLYLGWCTQASGVDAVRPAAVQDWLDLHTSAQFQAQVDFLASLVDDLPESITDESLDTWFTGMLYAENAFHDAVYDEEAISSDAADSGFGGPSSAVGTTGWIA
jgi:thiaminase/transcriptional activator TenA